jgi:hypothetical protein
MSLVNQFEITLKDFLPDRSDAMVITDRDGGTITTVSNRLYARVRAYADDIRIPLDNVVDRLRAEIHQPSNAYALTCTKCGHTGEMHCLDGPHNSRYWVQTCQRLSQRHRRREVPPV